MHRSLLDRQRGVVWVDGRFERVLTPGRYALWTSFRQVRVEIVDCQGVRFRHPELDVILDHPSSCATLERFIVPQGQVGLVYESGELTEELPAGRYAFWTHLKAVTFHCVDLRESVLGARNPRARDVGRAAERGGGGERHDGEPAEAGVGGEMRGRESRRALAALPSSFFSPRRPRSWRTKNTKNRHLITRSNASWSSCSTFVFFVVKKFGHIEVDGLV